MEALKKWVFRMVLAGGMLGVGAILLTTLRSGAADVARPQDLKASQRGAVANRGGSDYRAELAPPGAIAGQGIVEPADREVKLGAPVAGLIAKIHVHEGDRVKKGAPLVGLEDDVERAQLVQAQADLVRATADLERAREGRRPEEQRAAVSDARAARARADLSELGRRRQQTLKEKGAATADESDKATFNAEVDAANREAQQARADAAQHGWKRDVDVAAAVLAQTKARVAEARARLDRLTIAAPSDGTVLQLVVREGEYYNPAGGSSLVTLGDLSRIRIRLDVDERAIAGVTLGQSGYVTAEAFGARHFPGKVVEVGRRMGRKNLRTDEPTERIDTKILEVVLELDDGHELVPGLRAFGYLSPTAAR